MDEHRVIGNKGELPWHLPNDLKRFKAITMGKPIVMGRRTHESIGRPLPGRRNIVISRSADFRAPGCDCYTSVADALGSIEGQEEAMIIGGAALYAETLPQCSTLYLTEVKAEVAGDVTFPALDSSAWREISRLANAADESHAHAYDFVVLERITAQAVVKVR